MPRPFHRLTLDQFDKLLQQFQFTRQIDSVHMHHTWCPEHDQYNGEKSIESMWIYHTTVNHWSDIAQHVTVSPDGGIWTGRNWNAAPVTATGYNGTGYSGPFMLEIIGNFDQGHDKLEGDQLAALLGVIARVQERFGLAPETLRFHRFMTGKKSCPGTGIDYEEILRQVRDARAEVAASRAASDAANWAPRGAAMGDPLLERIGRGWACIPAERGELDAGEPDENEMTPEQRRIIGGVEVVSASAPGSREVGEELTPEMLAALRPHVINLNQGGFSGEGLFRTTPSDVDAIFDDYLERALVEARGEPLRLLFWSHGGLVSERTGLHIAHLQVEWWKKNGIYPIHFVWETGLCDALKQILSGVRETAETRGIIDFFSDRVTDPAIEAVARNLGGAKIWGAMKESARLASDHGGGAEYTAGKLAEFCERHQGAVQLHAVGHSAGSIFHSYFLPRAFEKEVPPFETLSLLAPAVRVDLFKARLLPLVGSKIRHLGMFTMKRDWEENDNVAQVYRKSLLYMIHFALEPRREEPILGLEISARGDREVADLFGLRGRPAANADVVWSKTVTIDGFNSSTSSSHGGFDNDRATMNSVLRRILNREEIVDFPDEAIERGAGDIWSRPVELPPELALLLRAAPHPAAQATPASPVSSTAPTPAAAPVSPGGGRRALCVGIDNYPTAPLHGCVSDARNWGTYLQGKGYQVTYLLNDNATRRGILQSLESLVTASKAGDHVVFQYSGHGTELDDLDHDEDTAPGTNGPKDEALCPCDFSNGAFVIDDDIAEVFAKIPDGVEVTCFVDCCHSGTITRFMVGTAGEGETDLRARFLVATPEMEAQHKAFRQREGRRGVASRGTPDTMRQVVFSACRDSEVAYESGGQGEFTVHALQVLGAGAGAGTNEQFLNRVTAAFGSQPRQHPELDCAPIKRCAPFLL